MIQHERRSETAYEIMNNASAYCSHKLKENESKTDVAEFIKIINLLYAEGYAYTKYCIENHFMANLLQNISIESLEHIKEALSDDLKPFVIQKLREKKHY